MMANMKEMEFLFFQKKNKKIFGKYLCQKRKYDKKCVITHIQTDKPEKGWNDRQSKKC